MAFNSSTTEETGEKPVGSRIGFDSGEKIGCANEEDVSFYENDEMVASAGVSSVGELLRNIYKYEN